MGKRLDLLQQQVVLVAQDRRPDGELRLEIAEYFVMGVPFTSVPKVWRSETKLR